MEYFYDRERYLKEKLLKTYSEWIQRRFHQIRSFHDYYYGLVSNLADLDKVVLDAACGDTGIMVRFQSHFKMSVGIDISFTSLKKNTILNTLVRGDIEKLPFRSECFDLIISQWTIEHLPRPFLTFKEFNRVLKKGGDLVLITYSKYNPILFVYNLFPVRFRQFIKDLLLPKEFHSETLPTYYQANSKRDLEIHLTKAEFEKLFDTYAGDHSLFLPLKPFFYISLLYEKLTDVKVLQAAKMHLIAHYKKRQ